MLPVLFAGCSIFNHALHFTVLVKRNYLLTDLTAVELWNHSVAQVTTAGRVPSAEAELDRYLLESSSYNVESSLGFWLDRLNAYPMLAPLALDLVSVPASQAYVERVFSLCGDLCARKRNRASVSLERRVFLKFNNMLMKIH